MISGRTFDSAMASRRRWLQHLQNRDPLGRASSAARPRPEMASALRRPPLLGDRRDGLTVVRDDFWATTSNKQLNLHVKTLLRIEGRAAIVVPDNVLFEGGAGETVRRKLLHECEVHTLLRLPTGVFYAQGVKANVLFFDRKAASETPWTRELWVYDLRTNQHFTLKENPLRYEHLREFIESYRPEDRSRRVESERSTDSLTTSSSSEIRRASTSSGCATTRSRTPTTSRRPE